MEKKDEFDSTVPNTTKGKERFQKDDRTTQIFRIRSNAVLFRQFLLNYFYFISKFCSLKF